MKSSVRFAALAAALAFALIGTRGAAVAQDKAKIIAEREDAMKEQGRQAVIIRNYTEGKADQAAALAAVESLTKSVPTVPNLFPPGTDGPTLDGKWATKPEVWSQHDKFLAAVKQVSDQVAAIGTAVKAGDKAKVEADFKELGFCKACHDTFRAKLQ
jgi:cytochrome c556